MTATVRHWTGWAEFTCAGSPMIRSDDTRTSTWCSWNISSRDMGPDMADAQDFFSEKRPTPDEYALAWSGRYEIIQQNCTGRKIAGLIELVPHPIAMRSSRR